MKTPAEIYAIVQDVPREAWPKNVKCLSEESGRYFYRDGLAHTPLHIDQIENTFVGSMAAFTLERALVIHKDHIIAVGKPPAYVVSTKGTMAKAWIAPTLLEALAAACKGVV